MTRVIVDKDLLAKLHGLRERLELYDEDGRCLAIVQPEPSGAPSSIRDVEIPLTDAEMLNAEKDIKAGKFFTTAEVLAHLKNLEKP